MAHSFQLPSPIKVTCTAGKCSYTPCVCNQGNFPFIVCRGKGDYHRLGHGDDGHQRIPRRIVGVLENEKIIDVACGSLHCVACTASGKVYAWGDNDEGQIGNNSTTSVHSPHVSSNKRICSITIACGECLTVGKNCLDQIIFTISFEHTVDLRLCLFFLKS